MVAPGAPWDYKVQSEWRCKYNSFDGVDFDGPDDWRRGDAAFMYCDGKLISAAILGNINYGYAGLAAGFTRAELYLMGGLVHQLTAPSRDEGLDLKLYSTFFDDPKDHEWIKHGMDKYPL